MNALLSCLFLLSIVCSMDGQVSPYYGQYRGGYYGGQQQYYGYYGNYPGYSSYYSYPSGYYYGTYPYYNRPYENGTLRILFGGRNPDTNYLLDSIDDVIRGFERRLGIRG